MSPPVVYGPDDRKEYFEVTDTRARSVMSEAIVALVPRARLGAPEEPFATVPTWGEVEHLCPEEPFRDQPAAAFCTGVLLDWDLVLTAGHCVRSLPIEEIGVLFDYYYEAPGKLAAEKQDVFGVAEVVLAASDGGGGEPRLDYAWLRLEAPADSARQPVPVYVGPPPLSLGDPIVAIGAGGGVPTKLDAGGHVRQVREALDFFVADADTSRGASGAGAFTRELALVGILARGGIDFVDRPDGCRATNRLSEELATEEFTYAHHAVSALCATDPSRSSLCRAECGEPCQALPWVDPPMSVGCSLVRSAARPISPFVLVLTIGLGVVLARRRSRRNSHNPHLEMDP